MNHLLLEFKCCKTMNILNFNTYCSSVWFFKTLNAIYISSHFANPSEHISHLRKVATTNQRHKRKEHSDPDVSSEKHKNLLPLTGCHCLMGSRGHVTWPVWRMKPGVLWQVQNVSVHLLITEVQWRVERVMEVDGSRDVKIIYGRRGCVIEPSGQCGEDG